MSNKNSTRRTKFIKDWPSRLAISEYDIYSASCNVCNKSFSIHNGGLADVRQRSKTAKHVKNEGLMKVWLNSSP